MIVTKQLFEDMINSPIRTIRGRVEVYEGSTLTLLCGCHDRLKSFTVERTGEEGKFFGFGICQKLKTTLLDKDRELNITKNNSLEVEFGVGNDYIYPYPIFYVQEVNRDENTNDLEIVAYDALYKAREYKVSELALPSSYTLKAFALSCANILGLPIVIDEAVAENFNLYFPAGANFEGTETVRSALDAIAEATQTVYFINHNWELTFKRPDLTGAPVAEIDKSKYITLQSEDSVQLGAIVHTTELGDTVNAGEGTAQYIRDNPFWELRADVGTLVDNALANIGGISANPFECDWRGNFLLEIGDKIGIVTKDDNVITSYLFDDTVDFNGALSGKSRWVYQEDGAETADNPTSLGDALNKTFAKVDKANKRIDLAVNDIGAQGDKITKLELTADSISASISRVVPAIDSLDTELSETKVELANFKVESNNALLSFEKEITENGVSKVKTSTDFTFDENGLSIAKSGSAINTSITENGMTVYNSSQEVLVANDQGVKAEDLHATTFLIIGVNSRFENYKNGSRTGCFWIGS